MHCPITVIARRYWLLSVADMDAHVVIMLITLMCSQYSVTKHTKRCIG